MPSMSVYLTLDNYSYLRDKNRSEIINKCLEQHIKREARMKPYAAAKKKRK